MDIENLYAITARFFRSMESVVKHSRTVETIDPLTNTKIVKNEVWNYTIADITLLAIGTSFPQISLATIDAIRNIGDKYAGGVDSKRCNSVGVYLNSVAIWAIADTCLLTEQTLAIFVPSSVCLMVIVINTIVSPFSR